MHSKNKILCIGAHPDDIELNCSGILLGLPFKSINVTATLGEMVTKDISKDLIKSIRKKEFLDASSMVNAETEILNFEDKGVSKEGLKKKIKEILKDNEIFLIITHFWDSFHKDHLAVGECIKELNISPPVLFWIDYSCLSLPSTFSVDITKHWESKCKILESYKSQINFREFERIFSGDESSKREEFFIFKKDIQKIDFLKKYHHITEIKRKN